MTKNAKKWICLLMCLMLTFLLADCGGVTREDETAQTSTGEEGEGLIKVSFQSKWIPQDQFMGYYVALEKGYYLEEGLDVEILPGGSDINVPSVVESGGAQFGTTNLYNLISYQEEGYPLVGIAQIFQDSPFVLVCNKEKIQSVEDLRGKTIGAWLGGNEYPIRALLTKYGMDPDLDVTLATQGTTIDGFLDGSFDAYSAMTYNELLLAYENGYTDDDLYLISMEEEGCGMLADMIFCNADWLADNRETAVKFLRASIKGWAYACQNVEEATDITFSFMDQSSADYDHQLESGYRVSKLTIPDGADASIVGFIDEGKVATTLEIALKYGIITRETDIDTVYDRSIYDDAVK